MCCQPATWMSTVFCLIFQFLSMIKYIVLGKQTRKREMVRVGHLDSTRWGQSYFEVSFTVQHLQLLGVQRPVLRELYSYIRYSTM